MRTRLPGLPTPIDNPTSTLDHSRRGGVGVGENPGSIAELATVIDVVADTYTYRVLTNSGTSLPGLARKRTHPADVALLPIGATVIVRYDLPIPYIDGVLDLPMSRGAGAGMGVEAGVGITGTVGYGGQGVSASPGGGVTGTANFRGTSEPSDLIPGDYALAHPSGSRVGALEGGVAVLVGSLLAQVRAHGLGDLVEIISRNFRHITDFGVFEVKNVGGKVGMTFRGATDQLTEAGNGEEHWTVRLDLGADADLLDFRLTTPTGETLFRVHIDGDGRCEVYGADGIVVRSGSSSSEPRVTDTAGDVEDRVGGSMSHTVEGTRTTSTGADASHDVGGAWSVSAVADGALSAGRDIALAAGRNAALAAQEELALSSRDGNLLLTAGHAPHPQSKVRATTMKGPIELASSQGGAITLETLLGEIRQKARKILLDASTPDSVILGGTSAIGHAAIYETLERVLLFMATTHDTHSHLPVTGPPVVKMAPFVQGMIRPAKSTRVGIGG